MPLIKRFLVTTADERTWLLDQPLLFLGEWCRLYNRKAAWKNLDAEVMPYHWDDREKLHRDYLYLQGLYEELLPELAERLNTFHCVEQSVRYWRILVGPWLGYFMQMLFDRWVMIERAISDYSIAGVRVMETRPEQVVPNDMDHFQRLFVEDPWNEAIYGQLLRGWAAVPIEMLPIKAIQSSEAQGPSSAPPLVLPVAQWLKHTLARATSLVSPMFTREDEAFFISPYLPIQQDLRLQWRLGQVPKLWHSFPAPKAEVDWSKRQWQMSEPAVEGFPAIVRSMIPRHMPALYLEGYGSLRERCATLPWSQNPRLIFTSNSYSSDDVFKAWAAEKVEAGVPLVVGQHGGSYGVALWGFTEYHQCAISDAWLSWGWEDEGNRKIKPVGNLKMAGRRLGWDPEGHALMVEMTMPRYSYHMYSVPVASQWLSYFEDQIRFVSALPHHLRGQLQVRLFSQDYGWCQKQRWRDRFPDIHLDVGVAPITPLLEKSRLYISTYNATTFLESLTMNIPTIIFWNPKHWELRDSAIPYFEQLKAVGIFHEAPESAAQQMERVWDEVATWWSSEPLQSVREEFCHRYSRMPEQPLEDIEQVFRQIARQPKVVAR